ncbi:hypothetical protein E4P39_11480 [Blastococcus sp. CT_GayMR19]|uniref:hypothetical protein n=1 Tax=Blastococcus sp. CT_GayMR19 TaxID=2559608 RepID=UPI0010745DCF|nr:hypothetical protein [Blastococcus sp. CT_GayMR19]TFV74882.1 hypothetical protein E4P39_11480 [Blastococcus sp. CT_GayMR19]
MTKAVEAPVAEQETVTGPRPGEWVITVFMLAFFAAAYLIAQDYPFRAALFPQMVSVLGFLLSVFRLIGLVRDTVRGRRAPVPAPAVAAAPTATVEKPAAAPAGAAVPAAGTGAAAVSADADPDADPDGETVGAVAVPAELELVDDDREDDASMEYVFASAGGRAWLEALSWIVAFFVAFFTLGAFLSVPLFALLYLRFSGRTSWLSAVIYAVVTGVLIYVAFRELVYIPLPTGYLPFMQF